MADDFILNPGTGGITARADQLLTGQYVPYGKVMDGTADSTNAWIIDSSGRGKVIGDLTAQVTEDVASVGGEVSVLIAGIRNDTAAAKTSTDGDYGNIALDSAGRVGITTLGGSITVGVTGTVTVTGSVSITGTAAVSAASLPLPTGAATSAKQPALGTAGAASADVLSVQGIASMTALKVDPSAVTSPVSAASLPLPTGASTAAKQPALGTAGSPSTDVITVQGAAGATALPTTQTPSTSGGYSVSRLLSAATTNATSVKASAGQVYGWMLFNTSAATKFFKLYNKASAPTVGTDTPFMTIPIPAGGGIVADFDGGIAMGTGIAFAITGAVTDADATAVALNDVVVNLLYK